MKTIKEMTIKEKIGQLIFVGFHGDDLTDELKFLIDNYKVGNVILFARNVCNIEQLFNLNKKIHNYILEKIGIIPFIGIDQEGGMVTRIFDGATFCPGNMTLATQDPSLTYNIGVIMGRELKSLGINMNFAPSLDVNNNPNNPVIGVRSYSDDPVKVATYGLNYIRGLNSEGVIATAKHFPGHGDTESDSHMSLPVIPHSKERLNNIELKPFKKCLDDAKAIMSAHVFFKAYEDNNLPATLSKKVITDLLRDELGYKGLIVSDCMEMKAISDNYTTVKGCLMGLMAGLDQVLVSQTFAEQENTCKALIEACQENILTEKCVDEKLERIFKLKEESYNVLKESFLDKSFQDVLPLIDNKEHKKFAIDIVDASLTLVKGVNLIPGLKTLVITTEPFATSIAEDVIGARSVYQAIKDLDLDIMKVKVSIQDSDIEQALKLALQYEQVLVTTYNANIYSKQAELVNRLHETIPNLFVLSTRSPYDLFKFPKIKNYLCLYEYTPSSCQTIRKYLQGKIKPTAKLPVSLNPTIGLGASLYVGLDEYPLEKNIEYINLLKTKNIKEIFISAHMKEMKPSFLEELTYLINNTTDISITLDVSKASFENLKGINVTTLRIDYGFSLDEIINLYNQGKYKIELNASIIKEEDLIYLSKNNVKLEDLRISHNFYPKPYTGLDSKFVICKNELFHKYNMKVMIYIPTSTNKRPPINEGLPTVESHRYLNLYSILSTIKYLNCDVVYFGDAYATELELDIFTNFNFNVLHIPILIKKNISVVEKEILLKNHRNRIDKSSYFIRSSTRVEQDITPFNTIKRNIYDVTIDNCLFKRYQGEVSIMKKELESDNRVNVIGRALINDDVICALETQTMFKFIIVGEIE